MRICCGTTERLYAYPFDRRMGAIPLLKPAQLPFVPNSSLHSRSWRPQSAWLCGKEEKAWRGHARKGLTGGEAAQHDLVDGSELLVDMVARVTL